MALLTEEQINDILDITNVCFSSSSAKKLLDWNEKQQFAQFEPDWSKAPEGTDSVIIKSYWVNDGIWTFGENVTKYDRPTPVITPHPHAAVMAKYAEVAARRVDPWVEFEVKSGEEFSWSNCTSFICFRAEYEYRHIGDDK